MFTKPREFPRKPLVLALQTLAVPLTFSGTVSVSAQQMAAIEEVVVTATRRTESIQDIPLNISAVGGDAIRSQGLDNLSSVMQWVPGVHVVDQGSRAADQIVVRGLNADPISASEGLGNAGGGTVATYVGEIPLYVDLKLNDMERVEVLLGPQGTLYGAGTLGGAIRYIPNKPQFDGTTVQVRGDLYQISEADDLSTDTGVTVNLPMSDSLALRVNVDYLNDSGFVDYVYTVREPGVSDPDPDFSNPEDVRANLRSISDVNDEQTLSSRVALRWEPTDRLDATFTYYYQDQDSGGRTVNSRDALGIGKYESGLRYVEPNERKNELYSLELTADLDFAELTSATGWSEYTEEGQRDQTDLLIRLDLGYEAFPSFSAYTREEEEQERFNQELRLVSTHGGPVSWIVGGFYNDFDGDASSREFTPGFDQFAVDEFGGVALRPDALEYYSVGRTELTEWALYGEVTYDITDRWAVTVGYRSYDYDFQTSDAVDFPLYETVFLGREESVVLNFEDTQQQEDGELWKFNTAYDLTDDVMAYFTYSEGYRIGAGNGLALCTPEQAASDEQVQCGLPGELAYRPDRTKNYELGLRTSWLDQRLTVNGSMYYVEWIDPQLASTTVKAGLPITINGEGAETSGFEFSFNWLMLDSLTLRGSFAYTKAELTADAPDLLQTWPADGFDRQFVDGKDGDRLPGSPERQGNLYASYLIPFGDKDLSLNYGITAVSDVLTKTGGRANGEALPGYAVQNLSANLSAANWDLTLYVDNLADKYAVTGVRDDRSVLQTVSDINGDPVTVRRYFNNMIQPRTVGLRATYYFDM